MGKKETAEVILAFRSGTPFDKRTEVSRTTGQVEKEKVKVSWPWSGKGMISGQEGGIGSTEETMSLGKNDC